MKMEYNIVDVVEKNRRHCDANAVKIRIHHTHNELRRNRDATKEIKKISLFKCSFMEIINNSYIMHLRVVN